MTPVSPTTPVPPPLLTGAVRGTVFALAIPVLGEQLLNTFVGLFDTYLAGRFGPAATSAVGLAAYVSWLAQMLVMLVGTGATALVARHIGAGRPDEADRIANQSISLGFLLGLASFAVLFALAPTFAAYTRMTGEAGAIASEYLRIDAVGHFLTSVTLVGCAALRGAGDMRTPMAIFMVINLVNVAASLILVYGPGPFPALGLTGIVCGTVTAKFVGAAVTLFLLCRGRFGLKLHPSRMALSRERTGRILRIGIPAAADGAVMWLGQFAYLAIVSRLAGRPLGEAYFAAHVIAVRVEAFTYLPAVAWGAATATLIGQSLGAGDARRARRVGHEAVVQCGLLTLLVGAAFVFGADVIYRCMSIDPLVRTAGSTALPVLGIFQPCMAVSIVYIAGLRGAGDTRFPLLISIIGAVLRIALGWVGGILLAQGLIGAWLGMLTDMVWRAVAAAARFRGGRWIHVRV